MLTSSFSSSCEEAMRTLPLKLGKDTERGESSVHVSVITLEGATASSGVVLLEEEDVSAAISATSISALTVSAKVSEVGGLVGVKHSASLLGSVQQIAEI
jgi:hypothetical protein